MAAFPAVITANLTATGAPVYLGRDEQWTPALAEALVINAEQELERLLQVAKAQEFTVCDPYSIGVRLEAERPTPLTARERIRSQGPTTGLARA